MSKLLALTLPGGETVTAPTGIPSGGISNNVNSTGNTILSAGLTLLILLTVILCIIYLILGGIRWITSGGDPKGIDAARKQIIYAVIGLIIVFLASTIVNAVGNLLGIQLLIRIL